eukprot:1248488-Rhodomonas_salina.2
MECSTWCYQPTRPYAMPGTDLACGTSLVGMRCRTSKLLAGTMSPFVLRTCYALPGLSISAIVLRACFAMSGTDVAYVPTGAVVRVPCVEGRSQVPIPISLWTYPHVPTSLIPISLRT